jgi:hypothetical protein
MHLFAESKRLPMLPRSMREHPLDVANLVHLLLHESKPQHLDLAHLACITKSSAIITQPLHGATPK